MALYKELGWSDEQIKKIAANYKMSWTANERNVVANYRYGSEGMNRYLHPSLVSTTFYFFLIHLVL